MTALEEYEEHVATRTRLTLQADMVFREKADSAIESLKHCVACKRRDYDIAAMAYRCREDGSPVYALEHCRFTPSLWGERK